MVDSVVVVVVVVVVDDDDFELNEILEEPFASTTMGAAAAAAAAALTAEYLPFSLIWLFRFISSSSFLFSVQAFAFVITDPSLYIAVVYFSSSRKSQSVSQSVDQ